MVHHAPDSIRDHGCNLSLAVLSAPNYYSPYSAYACPNDIT